MLDEDIIYKLGCSSINDLPPLGYLLFNLYRKNSLKTISLILMKRLLKNILHLIYTIWIRRIFLIQL